MREVEGEIVVPNNYEKFVYGRGRLRKDYRLTFNAKKELESE